MTLRILPIAGLAALLPVLAHAADNDNLQQAAAAAAAPPVRGAPGSAGGFGPLNTSLGGAAAPLLAVAVTPDGKTAAVGADNGTVVIYDLAGRAVRRTLRGHEDAVTCVAFSPDGK